VARLTVRPAGTNGFAVLADGSTTTDDDSTPVASYQFDFGDSTAPVTTFAPTASVLHAYADSGTYTVTLVATDTGRRASASVSAKVMVPRHRGPQIEVEVGYYDTHHRSRPHPKPDPWQGAPNVVFVGRADTPSGGWDASAVCVENDVEATLADVVVTVDIGSHHYALWGVHSIPAGMRLVLTQTAYQNFDGSDTNPAGCYGCSPDMCSQRIMSTVPVIHVTLNGSTTDYYDTDQVLNTRGADGAGCPPTGTRNDESHAWETISTDDPPTVHRSISHHGAALAEAAERPGQWLDPPQPNPSAGDQALRFGVGRDGQVKLEVYDVAGRLERTLLDEVLEAGNYGARLNLASMPLGLHYYRLSTLEGVQTRAFVLIR